MLPRSALAPLLAVLVLAVPGAAILAPSLLAPPAEPGQDSTVGPPLYAPNGLGAFPTEGALGTHGCAFPAKLRDVLAGRYAAGAQVCLENAVVTWAETRFSDDGEDNDDAGEADRTASFTVQAEDGSVLGASISRRWWQHGTPAVGMVVVVEGKLALGGGAWSVNPVGRWVDLTHPGEVVDTWRVAAGLIPEDTYVWLNWTTIAAVWRNNDGDNNVGDDHIETGTVCPTAHLTTETTPPYFGIVPPPPIGATVRMYGAVRYDDGHGWWEIHPIRAWFPLDSTEILRDCPDRLGESGVVPPGLVPDEIPPAAGRRFLGPEP